MRPAGPFLFLVSHLPSALDDLYAERGGLSRVIENYRPRAQQLELSRAVAQALAEKSVLVAEAGTGTGKTLAYLVPALLARGKTLISTGTKALQDQLFHRDLPRVRAALGLPVQVALLKGRANYLCRHHLERALAGGRLKSREEAAHLQAMARFTQRSTSGDRGELGEVPENSSAWALATSTRENCLGSDCPQFRDCFVMRARKQALEAELVVVNHHLFFADLWLRDEGVGELLPNCHAVILDEAHQLPEAATAFFGTSVTTGQLLDLAQDYEREGLLSEDARTDGNYRLYADSHVGRLSFIRQCRLLDMPLDDIRALLRLRDKPRKGPEADQLLTECLERVMEYIQELTRLKAELKGLRAISARKTAG